MHRQIWIPKNGGPNVLDVREMTVEDPAADEVRIKVRYSGINFADIAARMGLYPDCPPLPTVVGYEVSGYIDAVGANVTEFSEGDEVAALTRFGGYTTSANVPAGQVSHLPESVSLQDGAALPVQWLTAWLMLVKLGNIQGDERALVQSLGGGVGMAALQICQWRGATVLGTASKGKHERLYAMGADHCIDYRNHDFEEEVMRITKGKGVHVILDAIGGESFKKGYRCLAPMGRMFMFGASATSEGRKSRSIIQALKVILQMPKWKTLDLIDENKGVHGINLGHLWEQSDKLKEMLEQIIELVDDGTFSPVVDEVFPFDQVADAHQYIQDRKNFGKVLLEVEE
jgi:NADPH:quinone reductase-like Zn-dependent oxidoreductase